MSKLLEYFNGDDLAASVWQGKYAQEGEETPDDMHRRMAKEFAKIEEKYQKREFKGELSQYGKKRKPLTEESIYNLFKDFKYIVPQGSVMSQLGAKSIGSLSNCFVVGQPYDSYGGIFHKDEELAQLMKRRGGVGIDISTLRPEGVSTSNAAKSSTGAVSFMHRFSNTTREVAQNGRRGALMISIDVNHPDVLKFVEIKRDLSQVTGANISIKLNDEFMKAVQNDEDYILRFPTHVPYENLVAKNKAEISEAEYNKLIESEEVFIKKIKAKELWDEIIKSAHGVAEPGLMFWDNMVNYSPDGVYPQFRQVTTNPCSEIAMQPYDACRLIVVNLFSFVENPFTPEAYFDHEHFYAVNYEAMRLSDDLIDLELEHIERIIDKIDSDPEPSDIKRREKELWKKVYSTAQASRRTGLGFTALGDTLAALGVKYDSDDALDEIAGIMRTKLESEFECTADLALNRGTFIGWDRDKEFPLGETGNPDMSKMNPFYQMIYQEFPHQFKRIYNHGRRNVSQSTLAPTGTVSMLTQTTSGIEPMFQPMYKRRKKVNPNDEGVRIDFTDQNGDNWQEYFVIHPKFKEWIKIYWEGHLGHSVGHLDMLSEEFLNHLFKNSPWYGSTANDIDWLKRVRVQSIIQNYITHSISSTINLPEDVTLEAVSDIYMHSWEQGLKGITVYRDGSRSGVLVSAKENQEEGFEYQDAFKRPEEVYGEAHKTVVEGVPHYVIVGLVNGKPYEVFIDKDQKYSGEGKIIKKKRGDYHFVQEDKSTNITSEMPDVYAAICRMTSLSLRHRADVKYAVEQLNKTDGDLFSFTKGLARVLKKYIPDGEKATVSCKECGSNNVVFEEGCHKCLDCGSSKCG